MKNKNFFLALLLIVLPVSVAYSQKPSFKFGKVSMEELTMERYEPDTNAGAVILYDFGTTRFDFTYDNGFTLKFTRQVRIKFFNKEEIDFSEFLIPLYQHVTGEEEETGAIKGITFNLVDGEIEKTKLDKKDIFKNERNENWIDKKFTMPNVRDGSVIDVYYEVNSPFIFNLQEWYFQETIPVANSEYQVAIPEWFKYKNWIQGYLRIDRTTDASEETFSYQTEARVDGANGRVPGERRELKIRIDKTTYLGNNIPAFKEEPYITTIGDYLSVVKFELQSTMYPNSPIKHYTTTWEAINEELLDNEKFGRVINSKFYHSSLAEEIQTATTNPLAQMSIAYHKIKSTISWNGLYRVYASGGLNKSFTEGTGSSADINLNLVALCRKIGLQADPVLTSTRRHGKIRPAQAILTQFNHVIACITIDDEQYLLDAIDEHTPMSFLPPNTLNGKGWIVKEGKGAWVDLQSNAFYDKTSFANLAIDEDLMITGELQIRAKDYAARNIRKDINGANSEEDYIKELEQDYGFIINDYTIKDKDSINKPLTISAKIEMEDYITDAGERLYFNPLIVDQMASNPFKNENREYPVDYNYWSKGRSTLTFSIPSGYAVEELPKPIKVNLPDNKGSYLYQVSQLGNKIQLVRSYQRTETIFFGEQYQYLRQFTEMIVDKEAEQIVLVKTED